MSNMQMFLFSKNLLQNYSHKLNLKARYYLVRGGIRSKFYYLVSIYLHGKRHISLGVGNSKLRAQMNAACRILKRLNFLGVVEDGYRFI